jgi:Tol biopolymer transport system component
LAGAASDRYRLVWLSRDGKELSTPSKPDRYAALRISPDGSRVLLAIVDPSGNRANWILDLDRGIQTHLPSGTADSRSPVWSARGNTIFYAGVKSGSIFAHNSSGAGSEEKVAESARLMYPQDSSPDGRYLMYGQSEEGGGSGGLWLLSRMPGTDQKPILYLKDAAISSNAAFSPDGKWVSYTSNQSGQPEVYVQSFPATETRIQVSNGGGNYARWRKDGKELFYRAPDGRLMAISVASAGSSLRFSSPAALFRIAEPLGPLTYNYDVAADGQRILTLVPEIPERARPLTLFINWQPGVKK